MDRLEDEVGFSRTWCEVQKGNIDVGDLREIDAWGEERAARVTREHREQREQLSQLLSDLSDASRSEREIAVELRELIRHLRSDMDHEEAAVLDEDLLRDDVIGIDVETG